MSHQFDGNAAFSGGGFMPSQATPSANTPGVSPAKNRDTQTLLPLTVKQVFDAVPLCDSKNDFQIDGVDICNVRLVGLIFDIRNLATDFSFLLDDGTGRISCRLWGASDTPEGRAMEMLQNGTYVKVHGKLNGFQGERKFNAFSVRPIADYHEVTCHFADCIYVHCYNTRLQKKQNAGHAPSYMSNVQTVQSVGQVPGHVSNSAFNTPSEVYQSPANNYAVQQNMHELQGDMKLVHDFMQQPLPAASSEKGFNIGDVAQRLNIPVQKISEIVERLVYDGHIYSTIDDHHYKSMGND